MHKSQDICCTWFVLRDKRTHTRRWRMLRCRALMLQINQPEWMMLGINRFGWLMRWLVDRWYRLNFQTMSSMSGTKSPEKTLQNSRIADCGYCDKTKPGSCTPDRSLDCYVRHLRSFRGCRVPWQLHRSRQPLPLTSVCASSFTDLHQSARSSDWLGGAPGLVQ